MGIQRKPSLRQRNQQAHQPATIHHRHHGRNPHPRRQLPQPRLHATRVRRTRRQRSPLSALQQHVDHSHAPPRHQPTTTRQQRGRQTRRTTGHARPIRHRHQRQHHPHMGIPWRNPTNHHTRRRTHRTLPALRRIQPVSKNTQINHDIKRVAADPCETPPRAHAREKNTTQKHS